MITVSLKKWTNHNCLKLTSALNQLVYRTCNSWNYTYFLLKRRGDHWATEQDSRNELPFLNDLTILRQNAQLSLGCRIQSMISSIAPLHKLNKIPNRMDPRSFRAVVQFSFWHHRPGLTYDCTDPKFGKGFSSFQQPFWFEFKSANDIISAIIFFTKNCVKEIYC